MNKKFKYLVLSILVFVLMLFPYSRVSATTYKYNSYYVDLTSFTNATTGQYYIASGKPYKFSGSFYIHQISYDNNYFQGYCMHFGKKVNEGGEVSLITDFKNLKDLNGKAVPEKQIEILKNILASGYQNGNKNVNGSIVNNNGYRSTTCKDKKVCKNILATQILIWETIEGGRTNYDKNPNNISKNSYSFVSTDSELKNIYENILKNAQDLSSDTYIPAAFGNEYILKWNGTEYGSYKYNTSTKQYERLYLHIGQFKNNKLPDGVKLIPYQDKTTKKTDYTRVYISSSKEISSSTPLNFTLTKGSTLNTSNDFRWFRFKNFDGQDVLMGDYKKTVSASLKIKTEETKIKLRKIDENGQDLKGASFTITHCKNQNSCDSKPLATVDLSSNAMSGNIDIKKSGYYLISEKKAPAGRVKIPDFYIYIRIDSDTVRYTIDSSASSFVSVDKEVKDGKTSCLVFKIQNTKNEIKINKIDGSTNNEIKGATFSISKSSDKGKCDGTTWMNFKNEGNGVFSLSSDASADSDKIVDSKFSTYTIKGLEEGYYCLVERDVPSPYVLPSSFDNSGISDDQKTMFGISKNMYLYVYNTSKKSYEKAAQSTIKVKNYKSVVEIIKKGNNNSRLKGVEFELYKEDKTSIIPLTKTGDGTYDYSSSSTGSVKTLITNSNGSIKITGLPVGKYYMKETKAADGYTIDESVRWKEIDVKITKEGQTSPIGVYEWPNAKGEFCFYKIDEDGNYLSGGLFKLEMYSEKFSKYIDVAIKYNSDTNNYTLDYNGGDVYTFQALENGQTCFNNATVTGKYKIVEIQAPDGYVLSENNKEGVDFTINSEGYVDGATTIINKKQKIGEGTEAEAELVVNISTGQIVMKYGLIIGCILAAIIGLIVLNKKMSKK